MGLFQDADVAGNLTDAKCIASGVLCIFGTHTLVPISWVSKEQTVVFHSSTEGEVISLDALSCEAITFVLVPTPCRTNLTRIIWNLRPRNSQRTVAQHANIREPSSNQN